MAPAKSMIIYGGIAVILVIAGLTGVYFLWQSSPEEAVGSEKMALPPPPPPRPTPTPSAEAVRSARLAGVTLKTSDEVVRELVAQLSSHPKLLSWLSNEDLIRRLVASVDNIANGKSPRVHLEFLRPSKPFTVEKRRGDFVIDPASFERYNLVTGIFASLDARQIVRLLRELGPLLDDAYREIAPPNVRFRDTVLRAIHHLLRVPIVEDDIYLREKVITYEMISEELESLSDAQRHLLRMGPHNVRIIQGKLREIEAEMARPSQAEETEAATGGELLRVPSPPQ